MIKLINKNYNRKGFSIIEIIIYLAIFSVMSIVVINSFITTLSSISTIKINHDLLNSGSMAMERISREIRQSKSIDVLNSGTSTLQLNSIDSYGTNMIVKFMNENGNLNLYKDGELVDNLLGQNVILNSITFNYITTANTEAVKIVMTIQETYGHKVKIVNLYDTVTLRGQY